MPLEHAGKGTPGFGRNVATEVKAGKPQKQAVAIAYRMSGERRSDADPHNVHGYMDACTRGDANPAKHLRQR